MLMHHTCNVFEVVFALELGLFRPLLLSVTHPPFLGSPAWPKSKACKQVSQLPWLDGYRHLPWRVSVDRQSQDIARQGSLVHMRVDIILKNNGWLSL